MEVEQFRISKGTGEGGLKCSCCPWWSIYILLDVLLSSITEYFYELCGILASP